VSDSANPQVRPVTTVWSGTRPKRALAKLAEPIRREARDRLDARLPNEGCDRGRL